MPALFDFLLKVNIALLLFCAGYYLVLRHLTFYTLNRVYLIAAILFATVYPLINLDGFAQRHQQLARPVQAMVLNLQVPAQSFIAPLTQPAYWQWAEGLFFAGVLLFASRLALQLFSLYKIYKSSKSGQLYGHPVRLTNRIEGPFSFWRNIYINPANHNAADLQSILLHEKIHTDQWHTLDILVAELSVIFYWFNPGVWLMRKAVRENIEFITDRKILNQGIDSKKYQYSLLNVSFASTQPAIANHFNISTLKKRIIMMNAKRSSKFNLTQYACLVPVLLVCLFAFSFSKAELVKKSRFAYKAIGAVVTAPAYKPAENKIIATTDTTKKVNRPLSVAKTYAYYSFTTSNGTDGSSADTALKNNRSGSVSKSYTHYTFSTDTNKKPRIDSRGSLDSATILVDGVKVKSIKDVNPNDIENVNVSKDAANSYGVVSITTKWPHNATANNSTQTTISATATSTTENAGIKTNLDKMRGLTVSQTGTGTMAIVNYSNPKYNQQKFNSFGISSNGTGTENETTINLFADKMVFINGKEATPKELKKLSVADIASMSAKSGDEVIKQYGDKAKNGVVFIVTKKAK